MQLDLRGDAYWGWVLDGNFEQHASTYGSLGEYNDFRRFGESVHRKNIVDDRYVYGVGGAIGYPFYFCDCSMILAPVVGYSVDEINLRVDDRGIGVERESGDFFPTIGDGGCCARKYFSRWYGPFIGVDFEYRPFSQCWNIWGELEYHWAYFTGKRGSADEIAEYAGDRTFHARNGSGWVFAIGADYDICNCWTAGFSLKFQDYRASKHHRVHFRDENGEYDNSSSRSESGEHGKFRAKWCSMQST